MFNNLIFLTVSLKQISPQEGWLEHDPREIIGAVRECAKIALHLLPNHGFSKKNIASIGITNQRGKFSHIYLVSNHYYFLFLMYLETVVVWNKETGAPLYNAIGNDDTDLSQRE